MVAMVVDDKPFEIDDELYAKFSDIAGPGPGPVPKQDVEQMLAVCENDADRVALIMYLQLWRLMPPPQTSLVSARCDRYTRSESVVPICKASAKLRGRMPTGTTLRRAR